MHVHGFTALEVTEGAKRLGEDLDTYLRRLKDAGLRRCRAPPPRSSTTRCAILCPDKITTDEWLDCHAPRTRSA
jgi:2-iminoacetate synthase ThiH